MIDLQTYSRYYGTKSEGRARKDMSDYIMDATWDRDIEAVNCYLYDAYHDDEPTLAHGLSPQKSAVKTAVSVKYIINSYNTLDKDQVPYHIQFRPSQGCNVEYYNSVFAKRYGAVFPVGLYIDIPDNSGIYHRWLVVGYANSHEPQFDTWSVLPCDYRFQWITNGVRKQMWGVLRSQNSYNSGLWTDYRIETTENVEKFIVPMNTDTETLFYNQRMIVDAMVDTEPLAWKASKLERKKPFGIVSVTLSQDHFDQNNDYIEKDTDGHILGMWADYYQSAVAPDSTEPESYISYNGTKPQLKVGGSYKRFYVPDNISPQWSFTIDGDDAVSVLDIKYNPHSVSVRFTGDDSYIGKVMTISANWNDTISRLDIEICGI